MSDRRTFLSRLASERLIFDGGMGSLLQARGLAPDEPACLWNLSHPREVADIHLQYLEAGCHILKSNTFGANGIQLAGRGQVEDVVREGLAIARSAVRLHGSGWVALDMGPTGRLLAPYGDLDYLDALEIFSGVVRAGQEYADLILIETISDLAELKAAVLAARKHSSLPVCCTVTLDSNGKLLTGAELASVAAMLEDLGVSALGLNCGLGPVQMRPFAQALLGLTHLPVIVNPNAGLPGYENGKPVYPMGPEAFAHEMEAMAQAGARLLGGCCGTTPRHIAKLTAALSALPLPPTPAVKEQCLVCGAGRALDLLSAPVRIGERLNPTGKKRLKQALRDQDMDYILREALTQQEQGCEILDVNAGLPELDEAAALSAMLPRIQSVSDLPLQIDTADPKAMEAALLRYVGRPLINSVCGKRDSLAQILPLARQYGGVLVCLTLDEEGIPETVEGRLAIARRIVDAAQAQGISRSRLIFDCLTLPVSASPHAAATTLEAVRRIKAELGVKTILGVSNISHGLPDRDSLNAAFLTLALYAGLDCAIINPGSALMQQAWSSAMALLAHDPGFRGYTHARTLSGSASPASTLPAASGNVLGLAEAVAKGLPDAARQAVDALAASDDLETLIQEQLIPALDQVARGYEKGKVFLPQLLQCADAARAAFEALSAKAPRRNQGPKVILATVQGDVHDIGKNILKALLENFGFRVVDLGKSVPPQDIMEALGRHQARLVGLSCLMTTTVPAMESTIALIRQSFPHVKIMVGGAVLTEGLALRLGADAYGKDALAGVELAKRFLTEI